MAESTFDATDVQRGFTEVMQGLPSAVKDALQRGAYRFQPYIVKHMDRQGPPKGKKSTSPRIAIRTADTVRALTPKADGNIFDGTVTPTEIAVEYGIDLDVIAYPVFHEFADEFNVPFPARPFFYPGVADWEEKEVFGMESSIGGAVSRLWNAT